MSRIFGLLIDLAATVLYASYMVAFLGYGSRWWGQPAAPPLFLASCMFAAFLFGLRRVVGGFEDRP